MAGSSEGRLDEGSAAATLHTRLLAARLALRREPGRAWGSLLTSLLLGYAFLDKGFAYLGIYPLYAAEIVLLLGAVAVVLTPGLAAQLPRRMGRAETVPFALFLGWSLLRTLPYLGTAGAMAVRDAMVWGYAAFSFLIVALFSRQLLSILLRTYARALPVLLAWLCVAYVLVWFVGIRADPFGAGIPILQLKSGDTTVHLAAAGIFLGLGLHESVGVRFRRTTVWLLWLLLWVNWVLYGAISRAAMMNVILGLALATLLYRRRIWLRPGAAAVLVVGTLYVSGIRVHVPDPSRSVSISFRQLTINILSMVGLAEDTEESRLGTMAWRLDWWREIARYTFNGEYFWLGKGYGPNLADADGFQVMPDHSLRSPHNAFMTVLARSGVPGLLLWLAFLALLMLRLLRGAGRSSVVHDGRWETWLFVVLTVMLFNGSFDVYLEGPMGGVWFWSVVGFGWVGRPEREAKTSVDARQQPP